MSTVIKLVRVDQRLMHATVALNWNHFVNANYTVIVDPTYSNDSFITKVMQLCLPERMNVKIFSVEEFIAFMNEDSLKKRNLMIIFKNLAIAKEVVEAGFKTKEIQISYPVSRIMKRKLSDYFNEEEVDYIRFIQNKGIKLFFQTAPLDKKEYSIFRK